MTALRRPSPGGGALSRWLAVALLAVAGLSPVLAAERVRLDDGHLRVEVAPALGGRIVHVSLPGRPNLLKTGPAVETRPRPEPDAAGDNIPYLGHELWIGPQAAWWLDQDANPERRAAAAEWPPDPWLAHGRNRVVLQARDRLALEGVDSPVSGLRVDQTLRLSGAPPGTLALEAVAVNRRDRPVRRNLWFNTRVPAGSRVFVPVADPGQAHLRADTDDRTAAPVPWWRDGLYTLQPEPPPPGLQGRRGKVFIAPSVGRIAAFSARQLLLIRFPLAPAASIDPGHGQVELYLDWRHDDPDAGLLELEVHAPMRTLAPGARMRAYETWSVFPYDGPDTLEAQRAALLEVLRASAPPE